jgi:FAD/FMN-containing dehydrogenase
LTLGGGLGHLMRRCGLTLDNLVEADLVTADGGRVTVNASTDPDLFWGLRGGGGNFGVVTRFGFRLHQVGPAVLAGMVIHPLEAAHKVLGYYRDLVEDAPDALGTIVNLRLCPPIAAVPEHLHGTPVLAMVVCWSGDLDDGGMHLRPLREFGRPILDTIAPMTYMDLQHLVDATVVPGNHYYWRSADFERLTDGVIDTVVEYASRITSPISAMPIYHLGGAVGRVPAAETAFGSRAGHNVNMFAGWRPGDGDRDRHVAWVRDYSDAFAAHASGKYVNFLSDEGADDIRDAYGPDRWRRLVALKRRVDPSNLFRYNFNIDPAHTDRGAA